MAFSFEEWQRANPGVVPTPEMLDEMQSLYGAQSMPVSGMYDVFQNMPSRSARKKQKRPLPQGTLFGPMGAIGGLFGGGS